MWKWVQLTGELMYDGQVEAQGYSGAGDGKNNPAMQRMANVGPIPQGLYYIGAPRDTDDHGPYVLPLIPFPENEMFGRAGFLIHGDSIKAPGTASEGCIILGRLYREAIYKSNDRVLKVIAEKENA